MIRTPPPSPVPHALAEATPESARPGADPRLAALLPAELLQPGEVVILLLKPSPWYILLEPLRMLAILTLLTTLGVMLAQRGVVPVTDRDLLVLGCGVVGVRLFWQFLEWLSRVYVLTDRRIVRVQGVLRVQVFEAPLKTIQHTSLDFSIRERLFGLGTISFATAGTAFTEVSWRMLARPLEVHRIVVETLQRYRG